MPRWVLGWGQRHIHCDDSLPDTSAAGKAHSNPPQDIGILRQVNRLERELAQTLASVHGRLRPAGCNVSSHSGWIS